MKAENKGKLVRGVVAAGNIYGGCVVFDPIEATKHRCIVAYTHWYRHDDDLSVLDRELESLSRLYSNMSKTSIVAYTYEYKDYER